MDKHTWEIYIRDGFYNLQSFMKEQVKARDAYRKANADLRELEKTGDYKPEYIEKKRSEIDSDFRVKNAAAYKNALDLIGKLTGTMQTRYSEPLDLSDPALTNALNVINLAGANLDHLELNKIIDSFTGNPAALKTLRSVFQKQGMSKAEERANSLLYEPAFVEQRLREVADSSIRQGGSLNAFAGEINKLAVKEGMSFPLDGGGSIDPVGVAEAFRAGAGLPD